MISRALIFEMTAGERKAEEGREREREIRGRAKKKESERKKEEGRGRGEESEKEESNELEVETRRCNPGECVRAWLVDIHSWIVSRAISRE